jgi:hypothetical protein
MGSPAIDKGDSCVISNCLGIFPFATRLNRDQRRFRRGTGNALRVDIGAYEANSVLDSRSFVLSLFLPGPTSQRFAYTPVTITNTETMETRSSFISLLTEQGKSGGTPPLPFESPAVYLGEFHTKRTVGIFNPTILDF